MKIRIFIFTSFLCFITCSINSQNINWAKSKKLQSGHSSQVTCIKNSNVSETIYTCGWYYQMTPVANTTNGMVSSSAIGYISKHDSSGVTIWTKNITTTYPTTGAAFYPFSFALDSRDNIYVAGYYGVNAGFTYNIANIAFSGGRAYILKLDSAGTVLDTATFPTGGIKFLDIDLDANSNLYILGSSRSSWNYASTPIPNPTGTSPTLTRDFILSCDSTLVPRWVKPLGTYDMSYNGGSGSTSDKSGMQKLTVDKTGSGSVYVCGLFNANYSFQGHTFATNGTTKEDALIFKLDNSGNYVNGFSYGGVFHDALNSIQINRFGKLVTSGYFYTSAVINGNPYTTTTGFPLCYVSVLDTNLNYIYVQTTGIASFATSSIIDDFGRVSFSTKQQNLSNGNFLIFYDANGNVAFVQSSTVTAGNAAGLFTQGICFSKANSQILYYAGNYRPSVTFGPNLTLTSQSTYAYEIALLKFRIPSMLGAQLSLTALLQGLVIGNNNMNAAPFASNGTSPANIADTITVELHQASYPYSIAYSAIGTISTNGLAKINFPIAASGNNYYIVIKHRNSIETWSALPISFGINTNYDFSSATAKAFGYNLVDVGNSNYAIYVGDINQDGAVDFNDYPSIDIASSNGVLGYNKSDLNGDASVDFNDYLMLDINSINGVIALYP